MLVKSLSLAAAGLAAAATAFLIPPEAVDVSIAAETVSQIAEHQSVRLPCQSCPFQFRGRHGRLRVKQGVDSHLDLDFAIDHQPDHDRLMLNGVELYPNADPLATLTLAAPQTLDTDGEKTSRRRRKHLGRLQPVPPRLGFSLQWQPVAADRDSGMELVSVDFQVLEVGNTLVDGLANVHMKLIKTPEGGLMMGAVELTAAQTVSSPMDPAKQDECTTIVCKWRAIIADHLKHIKPHHGCAGKTGHHQVDGADGQVQAHRHHHDGRPFRMHEHSWSQLFKKFGSHIFFPIFVGIVAGVVASIFGMVVGTLIVGVWRVFVRRQPFFPRRRHHHTGHVHHKSAQKEVAVAEEKSGLMDHQDPAPSYEEEGKEADV